MLLPGSIRMRLLWAIGALALAPLSGCLVPFSTTTAYDEEVWSCEGDGLTALYAIQAECARTGSCGGGLSMRGMIEGVPLRLTSTQTKTLIEVVERPSGVQTIPKVITGGASPYFSFELNLLTLEGPTDGLDAPRVLSVTRAANQLELPDDDEIAIHMRLATGAEQLGLTPQVGSTVTVTKQELNAFEATFELTLADGDHLEGCMALARNQPLSLGSGSYTFD
jgi:hypothetical protein